MNRTATTLDDPAVEEQTVHRTSALTLIRAEFGRAVRTRSTIVFLSVAATVTLAIFAVRVFISGRSEEPLTSDVIALSSDVVGFVVMFSTALAVARDHQSGAIELVRVLIPARAKHLLALAAAHATLAIVVVLIVTIIGTVTILVVEPSAYENGFPADGLSRLLLTTALLAFAGAGIGAVCRSSAATTFVVLALYLLLPVTLMVAGFTGQAWASAVSDKTLGLLASAAISNTSDAWAAAAGVALWAAGLTLLGILREVKGK
ncbi:hypothetical protein [Luethyella okanaganae]|uniref:ABC transporter permease n=1 Tax=Luethyella okanaganae TaxID=69372 RepID=A0ABW1VHI1_9MICO